MRDNIRFENRRGERLAGVLHRPTGIRRATALFAHCFTCNKNFLAAVNIADALTLQGIAVLRFDFTGLGDSEGDFAETHFSLNVDDLVDAARWLEGNDEAPALLVGHSLGGTAALAAAHRIESVQAVATIGSPADAEHVLGLIEDDLETIDKQGEARVRLAGRGFRIRREFVEDVRSQSVRDGIAGLRRALLVMHSPLDEVVSIEEAGRIFKSARHPKSFVTLDDADHLLTAREDSLYAGRVLAAWVDRYLEKPSAEPQPARHAAGAVVVESRVEQGMLVSVNADGHRLLGDEPADQGGSGRGPTPYDYLATALGACTAMTLSYFARREQLPLEASTVTVRHERIHARDCADCESKSGRIDHLHRTIALAGDLDEEQRELLLKIADRCPVHQTLSREIHITNELSD